MARNKVIRKGWQGTHFHLNILPNANNGDSWLHKHFQVVHWLINVQFRFLWQNTGLPRQEVLEAVLLRIGEFQKYRKPDQYKDTTFLGMVVKQAIIGLLERKATDKWQFYESFKPKGLLWNVPGDNCLDDTDSAEEFFNIINLLDNPRIRRVLLDRFFLDQTLEQIGKKMRLTKERVRQLEAKGIRLLRQHPRFKDAYLRHLEKAILTQKV